VGKEHILVVDDEPGVRAALESILVDEGFDVTAVTTGEEALDAVRAAGARPFDAALLDVWLPGIDGLEVLRTLGEVVHDLAVVMISGHGTIDTAVRATKLGAFDFVEKPLSLERTLLVLRNALRQRRLERRNRQLLAQLSRDAEIVGHSRVAERLRREVALAAESDAPVLICGEPGSGRETVARAIHAGGRRSGAAFVEVPGSSLDAASAEEVLFGRDDRPGRLALAGGGSLFLEDVSSLEPGVQRRIVGAWRDIARQDTRVLASSGPGEPEVDADLRARLEVMRIDVPPLRERREDIPLLAERYLRDLEREYGRRSRRLGADVLGALKVQPWPGNLRELRNVIERLVVAGGDDATVRLRDLPESLGGARPPAEDLYREFDSLAEGLRAFERHYVARVLAEEGSDVAAAARRLKLSPEALVRRLEQLR
jgi:two-component system nitrogen regulation response regulator NtrX